MYMLLLFKWKPKFEGDITAIRIQRKSNKSNVSRAARKYPIVIIYLQLLNELVVN
jgi:hypothetical protein